MHRIDSSTATPDKRFTEGDPTIPVAATTVTADWLNSVQEELAKVVTEADLELDKADTSQLWQAIVKTIGSKAPIATTQRPGLVQIGSGLAVTAAGLLSVLTATATRAGIIELATADEAQAGTDDARAVTPAGLAARVATSERTGLMRPDGATCMVDSAGVLSAAASGPEYNPSTGQVTYPGYPGEFRSFMLSAPPVGWAVRNGAVLTEAEVRYPQLWAALLSDGMAFLKKTSEQWNALSQAAGGCGGAPFFVVDVAADTIKLPDTRGDYERGAGSSYLEAVGAWHGDAIRNASGTSGRTNADTPLSGPFYNAGSANPAGNYYNAIQVGFNLSRVVPTAAENRVRTFGMLPCVYIGGYQ